jgi:predicted dehydrogenase
MAAPIRWGIVGTANIARAQFLPALREAGSGRAVMVASRDAERAAAYASAHGVDQGVADYARLVESPDIDAVYVAVPNSLHAEWTKRALLAGKAVLCEKPLSVGSAQTAEVLDVARAAAAPLWEAFVFPFQAQHQRLTTLLADGAIGVPAEIVGAFHFLLSRTGDIRLSSAMGGGALADVGCYPIRLACELFGTGSTEVVAAHGTIDGEVEVDAAGLVAHGDRRLVLTCGFRRAYDTFTRVLGDQGQMHLTNPYHPRPSDTLTVHRSGGVVSTERPTSDEHSFTAALRHIHSVLLGEATPEHTAAESALASAVTLEKLQGQVRER